MTDFKLELAKAHMDIGLFTNDRKASLAFWQNDIGLEFDHLGKLGGGVHQLRHFLGDGPKGPILKINHARDPLENSSPSGLHVLMIAKDNLNGVVQKTDPDGNDVWLVPQGHVGVTDTGILLNVRDLQKFHDFYGSILNLPKAPQSSYPAYRCGHTLIMAQEDQSLPGNPAYQALGYRYLTLQIQHADDTHDHVLENGGSEGARPRTLGDTVRFSFIRDHDGNWIELSERASLTGRAVS